jgi:hypothetical protein
VVGTTEAVSNSTTTAQIPTGIIPCGVVPDLQVPVPTASGPQEEEATLILGAVEVHDPQEEAVVPDEVQETQTEGVIDKSKY